MVLSGVLAGAALVSTKLINDQKLVEKSAVTRDDVENLHESINSVLQNREHCYATMMGNGVAASLKTSSATTSLALNNGIYTNYYNAGTGVSTPVLAYGTNSLQMNYNVKILTMRLKDQYDSPETLNVDQWRDFEIIYERSDNTGTGRDLKKGLGAKKIIKNIPLRIQRNPNGTAGFIGCYSVSTGKALTMNGQASSDTGNDIAKDLCESLNNTSDPLNTKPAFRWDDTNNVCKPNASCPNQVFAGIDSTGKAKCNDIQNWIDFNNIIQNMSTPCPAGSQIGFEVDNTTHRVSVKCY
jgi:hypothetical protein